MTLALPARTVVHLLEIVVRVWLWPNNTASRRYINYLLSQNQSESPEDPFDDYLEKPTRFHIGQVTNIVDNGI